MLAFERGKMKDELNREGRGWQQRVLASERGEKRRKGRVKGSEETVVGLLVNREGRGWEPDERHT